MSFAKKNTKWCLLALVMVLVLALVLVSARPWAGVIANADETIPIVIVKEWNDKNNADGSRPQSVKMQIEQNGEPWRTVTLTAKDGWTTEITDAPMKDADGNRHNYTLTEELPDGYTSRVQRVAPGDRTTFKMEVLPSEDYPHVGSEFRYIVNVSNNSTFDGTLSVTMALNDHVSVVETTDGGDVDGNIITWTGVPVAADSVKTMYVTVSADKAGSMTASAKAIINNRTANSSYTHEITTDAGSTQKPEDIKHSAVSDAPMIVGDNEPIRFTVTNYHTPLVATTYTVIYKDGVDGSVFEDYTAYAKEGEATPAYPGTPEREGYKFIGWNPQITRTMFDDAVYRARWEKDPPAPHVHTMGEEKLVKAPTCTEDGSKGYVCTTCGEIFNEFPIPAIGHSSSISYADHKNGLHDTICSRCNQPIRTGAHTYGDWYDIGDMLECECTLCGATLQCAKDAEMATLTFDSGNGTSMSHTFPKDSEVVLADRISTAAKDKCFATWVWGGRNYEANSVVTLTGDMTFKARFTTHDWRGRTLVGTCVDEGEMWQDCKRCGVETEHTKTGLTDHLPTDVWVDDCGTFEDELCEGHSKLCTVCGTVMESGGHTYGEWETLSIDDSAVMMRTCECGHKQFISAPSSIETVYNGKVQPITHMDAYDKIKTNLHDAVINISYKNNSGEILESAPKDAAEYTVLVTATYGELEVGPVEVAYTIKPATLTATYKSETVVLRGTIEGVVTVNGLMHEDADMADFEYPAIDLADIDLTKPGEYTLTPAGGKAGDNYVFEYVAGTLTIKGDDKGHVTYPVFEKDPTKTPAEDTAILDADTRVIVDPAGGKWVPEDKVWVEANGKFEYTVKANEFVTLRPAPAKDGNLFMGWEMQKQEGEEKVVVFTARWGEITVEIPSVVYNGKGQEPNETLKIGEVTLAKERYEITDFRGADGKTLGKDEAGKLTLPKNPAIYTVEFSVKNATGEAETTVTGKFEIKPAMVRIVANIAWDDMNNADKLRPNTLSIDIYQDGKLLKSQAADEKSKWGIDVEVEKYGEDGKEHVYTVSAKAPKDYEASVDKMTITMKHASMTKADITVAWNDGDNKDKMRPSDVDLVIYQNGKAFRTVKVQQKDSWKLSLTDLPKFDADGKEFKYTLGYDKVPNGYKAEVKDMKVTYTHTVKEAEQKPNTSNKPTNNSNSNKNEVVKTGEPVSFLLFGLLGLGAASGTGFAVYRKRRKNDSE